jgi:hypothetical protein
LNVSLAKIKEKRVARMPLATMNWKRGLLRLWAVAAVLWVIMAFYSNDTVQRVRDAYAWENNPYAKYAETSSAVTLPPLPKGAVTISGNSSAAESSTPQRSGGRWGGIPVDEARPPVPPPPPGFYLDAPSVAVPQKTSIWPPIFDFAKLAFIPPLLLLALGYIGLWVGRGFRR